MFSFSNTLCSIIVNQSSFRTQKVGWDLDTYPCAKWNQSMDSELLDGNILKQIQIRKIVKKPLKYNQMPKCSYSI